MNSTSNKKRKRVALAAREFALPCPRTGSIEAHSGYGPLPASGQELHQAAQAARLDEVPGYEAEKRVALSFSRGGYEFAVGGRIDGVYREGELTVVEEIKTAFDAAKLRRKLEREPWHPYALQAMTYAYALETVAGVSPVVARLRVVSARTLEGEDVEVEYERASYEAWLDRRLDELVREAKAREAIDKRRRRESARLEFPFPRPRAGQLELIAEIERGIADGKRLLLQAPTGLGKTAGAIFPLLKDALERGQPLVYVTPKNSQHQLAVEAVKRLQARGAKVKSLSLTAKSKICFKDEPICDPERCEFARDHYKKMAEHAVVEKAAKKKNLGARSFRALAEKYEVCPFELSLEALPKADVAIGDYNYVFAPRNVMGRLTEANAPRARRPNLAVDEAHCLPSRACDYFSPELSTRGLEALRERMRALPRRFAVEGEGLLDRALEIVRARRPAAGGSARIEIPLAPFLELDGALSDFVGRYLASDAVIAAADPALRLRGDWSDFASALALAQTDASGRFAVVFKDEGAGALKIVCSDASEALKPAYEGFANVVAFSATLKPFAYYAALTGLEGENARQAEFLSPFAAANRKVLVIPQVSTKWSARAANYGKIADGIARIAAVRPGHYFAFFPSFDFLEQVARRLVAPPGFEILQQAREGRSAQVKAALERLREPGRPAIILGVQGGVFAEGVDYPGEMLVGAIVVGPALPAFGIEREIAREYFQARYGKGFDYAYAFPAMAKSVQAAGRVIRTETDRGLIVLMDGRFLEPSFAQGMPTDWHGGSARELVSTSILAEVAEFWSAEGIA